MKILKITAFDGFSAFIASRGRQYSPIRREIQHGSLWLGVKVK